MMQGQRELSRLHKLRAKIRREIARIDLKIIRLEGNLGPANGGRLQEESAVMQPTEGANGHPITNGHPMIGGRLNA